MENQILDQQKKLVPLTFGRALLYQFVLFPLLFVVFSFLFLFIMGFLALWGAPIFFTNTSIIVVTIIISFLSSLLSSFLLAGRINKKLENNGFTGLTMLISPVLFSVIIMIFHSMGSTDSMPMAVFFTSPFFILPWFILMFIFRDIIPLLLVSSLVIFSISFVLISLKYIRPQSKKLTALLLAIVTLVSSLAVFFPLSIVYPEIEYAILKTKYKTLQLDDVDYKFFENLPFKDDNKLVKMPNITINFADIPSSPRLDGATAFYPVYASIVENAYGGLRDFVAENELYYYQTYYDIDGNIALAGDSMATDIQDAQELIRCTQTSNAYARLAEKKSDIVFAFAPSDAQVAYAKSLGVEFEYTQIGYDAFCFFVSEKNPVSNLSLSQVQDIYSGKTQNWKKVGGKNRRIFAFTRPKNSGSQTAMETLVMKDIAISTRFEPQEVRSMGGIIAVVDGYLNTPNAIGYTFMYYSSFMVSGESIKYLSIDGVMPSVNNVKNGSYMFSIPFYAVSIKGEQTAETTTLLNWLTSEQGQSLITQVGYVPL